jgi:hypothetical protein
VKHRGHPDHSDASEGCSRLIRQYRLIATWATIESSDAFKRFYGV